jgi:hypothetical protein
MARTVVSTFNQISIAALFLVGYLLTPVTLIWGWARWMLKPKSRSVMAVLSFIGFTLASASALLALSAAAYSLCVGGFQYYDPRLMKIFGIGFLLSLSGLLFGVVGVWRASSLRWHAPACSIATLAFWIVAAAGE